MRAGSSQASPVSSRILGLIEGSIGKGKNARLRERGCDGATDAGSYWNLIAVNNDRGMSDGQTNSLRALPGLLPVTARKHNQKFLATIPAYEIVGTNHLTYTLRNLFEDGVSGQVAIGIVDGLEVVQIKHQDANGLVGTGSTVDFSAEQIEHGCPVPDSSQHIVSRLKTKFLSGTDKIGLEAKDTCSDLDPSVQFSFVEGLGQVVIGPGIEAPDNVLAIVIRGDQQNVLVGHLLFLTNPPTQLHPVNTGHDPVQNQ
jgi:hypothetical protein